MYTYAQIVNSQVYWIFEHAADITTLYTEYFNQNDITLVDITSMSTQPEVGWSYDGTNFTAPVATVLTTAEIQAQQIAVINGEYLTQFQSLQLSYAAAQITGNTTGQTAIQTAYTGATG